MVEHFSEHLFTSVILCYGGAVNGIVDNLSTIFFNTTTTPKSLGVNPAYTLVNKRIHFLKNLAEVVSFAQR